MEDTIENKITEDKKYIVRRRTIKEEGRGKIRTPSSISYIIQKYYKIQGDYSTAVINPSSLEITDNR